MESYGFQVIFLSSLFNFVVVSMKGKGDHTRLKSKSRRWSKTMPHAKELTLEPLGYNINQSLCAEDF